MNHQPPKPAGNHSFALGVLTTLFFMMGFITCMNDILIPHLKGIFNLTYTQAMLVQFCFFAAYFVMSVPMGRLVEKIGYQNGVVGGFLIAAAGCLLFYPAAGSHSYPVFLGALFVLASGIVLLQVAGNPYVTLLAKPGKESTTLTLVQAFNSLATMIAPPLGAVLIFVDASAGGAERAASVQIPYLGLAGFLLLLAATVKMLRLPDVREPAVRETGQSRDGKNSVWQYRHMVFGTLAIFCYVGAEVAIGSLMINVLEEAAGVDHRSGALYLSVYWGGAMAGRFIGSALMNKIAPNRYLAFHAVAAAVLVSLAIAAGGGQITMWSLLLVGLFNSIMFPTIFSLATQGLGRFTGQASGIICTAIVGGAVVPVVQGLAADRFGLLVSFAVPVVCYLYILFFGLKGYRAR
ncbi:sugar MFS transporter [Neisseria leonii]|uniref:sugar MFS transporter n=1 Tax=Neisseria leonii TaxID=2995413 RepID=UPI00237BFD9C|nr:sugar MFS transporter [Neisseria sp. 3986]MDD9325357.1 sugar MFS transporter [Neisseria sp. 3986]